MRFYIDGKWYRFRPWVVATTLCLILFILMCIVGTMDRQIELDQYRQNQELLENQSNNQN